MKDIADYVYLWRNRRFNRRCVFCVWCNDRPGMVYSYECVAKKKLMTSGFAQDLKRPFCSLFVLDRGAKPPKEEADD